MIEPGAVLKELDGYITDADPKKASEKTHASVASLQAEDVAAAFSYALAQPATSP